MNKIITILDGRKISKDILEEIKKEVSMLPFVPVFCDVLVGDDIVSKQYVNLKRKKAESIGINFHDASFPSTVATEEVISKIHELNKMEYMCGIIVQLPLPSHLDTRAILDAIDPNLDVDCLGSFASKNFYEDNSTLSFPTALACMRILEEVKIDLSNSNVVVLGQGELVGKPVSHLLTRNNIKHTCLDSKSENTGEVLKNADLIISGIGREYFIKSEMIKEGVSIIDAGTSESEGSVVGDVDFESVKDKVDFISPVPGGVGPVTVAMLFNNVLNVAKQITKNV
jgi:methylenetetrahydrofolate dehydrogenase (NADP+)/methenyltetrahydrofolate cyclohydrolase